MPLILLLLLALPLASLDAGTVAATARRTDSSPAEREWRRTSGPADVAPPGWRKVADGWQRIDGQPLPDPDPGKTLNNLIRQQRSRETECPPIRFLATLMLHLRMLDPITVASAEISAICLLAYRVLRRE